MVRRVSYALWAICVGLWAAGPAQAREQIVMPFDCTAGGGIVTVTPAAAKSYPIVGDREEQAVTYCGLVKPASCRSLAVHRFDISCGGTRVSWMRVVGAIQRAATARSGIENGQLRVLLPADHGRGVRHHCFERRASRLGELKRSLVLSRECLPWGGREVFNHQVVLPAGYGPVSEVGASLFAANAFGGVAAAGDAVSNVPGLTPYVSVSADSNETVVAKADFGAMINGRPDPVTLEASSVIAPAAAPWITIVRSAKDAHVQMGRTADESGPGTTTWLIFGMVLATLAVAVHARAGAGWPATVVAFVPAVQGIMARVRANNGSGAGSIDADGNLTNAGASIASYIEQADAAVSKLKGAGPLREVLLSELKQARQRLTTAEAVAKGKNNGERAAPQFRALVRDLERIHRIADSAAVSLTRSSTEMPLPRTVSEAYTVLGINPDVSKDVFKKIVDALRMSWHPDHARDEEDRCEREARIRQINAAVDLINEQGGTA